jgi:hypothetical protein
MAYSFYGWADYRRLLLAWPSVSSSINEKRFLSFFLNLIDLFYFYFIFVCLWPERRVLEDTNLG